VLDLTPDLVLESPVDEVSMTFWTAPIPSLPTTSATCSVVGSADPNQRGLRLRAVYTCGHLDLDNLATTIKLVLLDEGITAVAARLPGLSLQRCLLIHPSKPALCADELRTDAGLSFEGFHDPRRTAETSQARLKLIRPKESGRE
jgi:hypothetical protein